MAASRKTPPEASSDRRGPGSVAQTGARWASTDPDARFRQRDPRHGLWRYLRGARPGYIVTAPVIYSLVIPLALLDLWVTVFQRLCFPLYGIARVRRRDVIVIDRHKLPYLNLVEKLNCVFCGYASGVIAYTREVAARTEAYWCPIKHARAWPVAHDRYDGFLDYGDETEFFERWADVRRRLRDEA